MDKQLNILFLCSWYPNPDSPSNGIFIKRHAEALALSHKVTVIFVKSVSSGSEKRVETLVGNLKEVLCYYKKPVINIPVIGSFLKFLKFKSVYKKQINLLNNSFDVIHLNTIFPAAIPALYAIKKNSIAKFFITEHWSGYYAEDGNYKGFLSKYFTRKIVAKANAIFVISEKLKIAMQSHQLNGKYELINNVVDTKIFKPTNLRVSDNKLRVLHVSSLVDKEKNITGIIEIARELKQNNFPFHLTIVGFNTDEINTHKALSLKYQLDLEITFVGYKTPIEVASYMNTNDVFLLFSNYEGMPVVLLEAMACGLPVISTSVGEVKNIVNSKFGIVLNSNNIDECVEKLCNFNRNDFYSSKTMFEKISMLYSHQKVCESITRLYNSN